MNKHLLILAGMFFCFYTIAQELKPEKPDYKKIETETSNKDSKYYYPILIYRYKHNDTTLSADDFRYLYYGFLFQDSYSPYKISDYSSNIKNVLNKDSLIESDYDTLIKYEKLVLDEFPFNLRDLNYLAYTYYKKGESDSVRFVDYKLKNVINTILSTGDGEKEKTAWHVVSVSHEYDILNMLGYKFGGMQSLTSKGCDYLTVMDNKYGIKGFYFDVNKILEAESKALKSNFK